MSTETTQRGLTAEQLAGLALLRQEVPENLVGKLPKVTCGDCRKKNCASHRVAKCKVCDAWIGEHMHLDFVGHAETTSQLLEADIEWNWEPLGFTTEGLPAFDDIGGLWIKLTVCGVTRLGYGTADNANGFKAKGDVRKEIIGDALRNAGMRFGWGLNLWAKTDIHERSAAEGAPQEEQAAEESKRPARKTGVSRSKPTSPPPDEWAGDAPAQPTSADQPARMQELNKLNSLISYKHGNLPREERLGLVSKMAGRALASSKDLTRREASSIIEALEARPDVEKAPFDMGAAMVQAHADARARELLEAIKTADEAALDSLMSQATEARDAGQISDEQWSFLSGAANERAAELVQAMAGEESQDRPGWSHRVLAAQTGAAA